MDAQSAGRYYNSPKPLRYHFALLPYLFRFLEGLPPHAKVLDAGCGNGFFSGKMLEHGYRVTGIDVSTTGIEVCRREYPDGIFHAAPVDSSRLPELIGTGFDAIVAMEVVEHLYSMKDFLENCRRVLSNHGSLVISTPYHGYWKNLGLALSGRLEAHLQPEIEGGHIKFWSRRSITRALETNGFQVTAFAGCGRWPHLWKSMLIKAVPRA